MFSVKNQIRLILILVTVLAWGMTLLSIAAINRMIHIIDVVISQDAAIAEMGDRINLRMLEARRDEKNFIIFSDSAYLVQNRTRIRAIIEDIHNARKLTGLYRNDLDSIDAIIRNYNGQIDRLSRTFKDNPRSFYRLQEQLRDYDIELKKLAHKHNLDYQDITRSVSDSNLSVLAASLKVSSEQVQLFTDLRETGDQIQRLSKKISSRARDALSRDADMSVQYGLRIQKWVFSILIVSGLVLIIFIIMLPQRLFRRLNQLKHRLQAISRGETVIQFPINRMGDEIDELSGSFSEAIEQLKFFNDLKTERIIEIERNLRRIIDEVEEAVFILSEELKITHVNRAAQNLFDIDTGVIRAHLKTVAPVWESLGDTLSQIEKTGRFEATVRIRGRKLKKHHVTIMPIMGLRNRLESVVIFIR